MERSELQLKELAELNETIKEFQAIFRDQAGPILRELFKVMNDPGLAA
jgi:hypothetical protein